MNKDLRELIEWAGSYGWSYVGLSGTDHPVIQHTSGKRLVMPSSPSDWRSWQNTRADIRRIAGEGSDSGPAAKYRKGLSRTRPRFSMDAALAEQEQRETEALCRFVRLIELQVRFYEVKDQLLRLSPKKDKVEAVRLAQELRIVREELRVIGGETPPLQGL
jgi:hypothetical protein